MLTDSDNFDSFIIEKIKEKILFKFKITLSINNFKLLYYIKSMLGYGKVLNLEDRKLAIFTISDREVLKKIIFPIFDKHTLLTSK